jgi:hypothetical protein
MEKKKKAKKIKINVKIVNPVEIYFTEAEEMSVRESLKNLNNKDFRNFAIQNIVECFEEANKRKDINWRKI